MTLLPNVGRLNSVEEDHWFVKTGDKGEIGKAVQSLGCAAVTPRAKVPVSACGYDTTNKGCPPNTALNPRPANNESFPGQSNLLNLNLSPYFAVFMELLQGLGLGGTTLGP